MKHDRRSLVKVSVLAMAVLMVAAILITVPAPAVAAEGDFTEGDGSETNPYVIKTLEELQMMNDDLNAHYELGTMIYSEEENFTGDFTPIGNATHPFNGTLNGAGFWILNLQIDSSEDKVGLFGQTTGNAIITKVGLEMATITGGNTTGGLVGLNMGNISQCLVTGSVSGGNKVGGLVGYNDGNISDCYSTANVSGGDSVGGLVGWNGVDGDVTNTYSIGNVSGDSNIGGLIGGNQGVVTDSFWDTNTSGMTTSAAGEGKTTEEMQNQTTFSAWDFDDVWRMTGTYPRLQALPTIDDIAEAVESILDEVCSSAGVIFFIAGAALVSSRRRNGL